MDILEILESKGIEYVSKGNSEYSIQCPNALQHEGGVDSSPSFNINIDKMKAGCFVCGLSMSEVGLTRWLLGDDLDEFQIASLELKGKLKRLTEVDYSIYQPIPVSSDVILPPGELWDRDYRNIPKELYKELGAIYCTRGRFSERIILPIKLNGILRGFESRTLVNAEPKYLRNTGFNAKSMGLYPYDHVKAMRPKSICLAEGVFDALNLISSGFSAICIFGTQTFSMEKLTLLLALGCEEIIMFFDKDLAGITAQEEIAEIIKPWIKVSLADQSKVQPNVAMTLARGKLYWQDAGDLSKSELEYCVENRREFR